MSLEENFRSFYSNFGIEQDPGNFRHVFNELYHDDFKNELDGKQSLDKGQLWNIQEVVIKSKTTASVLMFKYVNPDVVEYKVHFKGTDDPVGKTVHCAYELKEGKIFNGRAVDKSSVDTISETKTASANFSHVQKKMQSLFNLFDGVPRSFDSKMDQAFEALFHREFIHNMDGKPHNKAQRKERFTAFAETGTRFVLLTFEPKDEVHYEASIRVVNENIDEIRYARGTISDSMLLKIEPLEDMVQKVVPSEEHACSVDKYGDLGRRSVTADVRYHLPASG